MRILIGGSRTLHSYEFLEKKLDQIITSRIKRVIIVTADNPGADTLAELWAWRHGYTTSEIIDWRTDFEDLESLVDRAIIFWDGRTDTPQMHTGTNRLIAAVKASGMIHRIIKIPPEFCGLPGYYGLTNDHPCFEKKRKGRHGKS